MDITRDEAIEVFKSWQTVDLDLRFLVREVPATRGFRVKVLEVGDDYVDLGPDRGFFVHLTTGNATFAKYDFSDPPEAPFAAFLNMSPFIIVIEKPTVTIGLYESP